MIRKFLGAALVIAASLGCGLERIANHKREEKALSELIHAITEMENELRCHQTPLYLLFQNAANGVLGEVMQNMSQILLTKSIPDAQRCMELVLIEEPKLPQKTKAALLLLGRSLGKFDLAGQLQEFSAVKAECQRMLDAHCHNQEARLRSYWAASLCFGILTAITLL